MSKPSKKPQHPEWINKVPGPMTILLALFTLAVGYNDMRVAFASDDWPSTDGIIEESRIAPHRTKKYKPVILYSYEVDGAYYYSYRIRASRMFSSGTGRISSRKLAREQVEKYPEGSHVTVAYDPNDPDNSVLVPGLNPYVWILPFLGMALLAAGVMVFRSSFREKSK